MCSAGLMGHDVAYTELRWHGQDYSQSYLGLTRRIKRLSKVFIFNEEITNSIPLQHNEHVLD